MKLLGLPYLFHLNKTYLNVQSKIRLDFTTKLPNTLCIEKLNNDHTLGTKPSFLTLKKIRQYKNMHC